MKDKSSCEYYDGRCRIAGWTDWETLVVRDVGRENNPCLYGENPQQEGCPRPGTTRPPLTKGMKICVSIEPSRLRREEHSRKQ
jgi:hypothetical protein